MFFNSNKESFTTDDVAVHFAKIFNSESGEKVLAYLNAITVNRYLGPMASDAELRYLEGQRFLISFISNMIKKGQGKI